MHGVWIIDIDAISPWVRSLKVLANPDGFGLVRIHDMAILPHDFAILRIVQLGVRHEIEFRPIHGADGR